ncbi:MAG: NUDIX hydrolase [Solirubrobacteraceae bacterium]
MPLAAEPPLMHALSTVLDDIEHAHPPGSDSGKTPAAVLVALREPQPQQVPPGRAPTRERIEQLNVVLTQRRADLRRHAGEIAFPGGRRDQTDRSLQQTALREAREEIGLAQHHVSLAGTLAVTHTFATNYAVYPFVGLLDPATPVRWRASSSEVASVLEVSLAALRASQTRRTLTRRGFTFETDVYTVGDQIIWGVTWRILADLLERLERLERPA